MGRWLAAEAGVGDLPMDPMALHQCQPPWTGCGGSVQIELDLPVATRRSDPPEVRREAAMRALERLPPADVTIWSDGSAREGTNHGGAGALIQLHHLGRDEEVRATAGMVAAYDRSWWRYVKR